MWCHLNRPSDGTIYNPMGLKQGFEIHISGIVQGVGFRPFVYNLAKGHNLHGTISNTSQGVYIKIWTTQDKLTNFINEVRQKAPPLSEIEDIHIRKIKEKGDNLEGFSIIESSKTSYVSTLIPPDMATCPECLEDIFDPGNRRFHYPFTNCTNCGPRYTIIESLPYDRPATSMKTFKMCSQCLGDYENPLDRRFHAQPNCCPLCGPHLWLTDSKGKVIEKGSEALVQCAQQLAQGAILAIKGLGGFHLAANGYSLETVKNLRTRKKRPFKPFAVMVKGMETAKRVCRISKYIGKLLCSPQAPIVLAQKAEKFPLPENIAPNLHELGVMLPYTPFHHLLFAQEECPDVLIMTSGNPHGEPLCTSNEEALTRLSSFADLLLLHNREIRTGVDDSVIRASGRSYFFIRRSRGYAPAPVKVAEDLGQIIALGAELKNTFCLTKGNYVFLSQHIGDVTNPAVYDFLHANVEHMKKLLEITPKAAASDLHPDYLSSRYAKGLGLPLLKIQHHHAHSASVMAEHGLEGPVLSLVLDGTGLGPDNTIWGGEILLTYPASSERLGHLVPFFLPGGDAAAKEPWRSGLSLLYKSGMIEELDSTGLRHVEKAKTDFLITMLEKKINCPVCTSCGRLFDGMASIMGICLNNSYEGQAAMELESLALKETSSPDVTNHPQFKRYFDTGPLFKKNQLGRYEILWPLVVKDTLEMFHTHASASKIALSFHIFLVAAFSQLMLHLAEKRSIEKVVMSGGTMQNNILRISLESQLSKVGLKVFLNEKVPPNDGGISLGQAYACFCTL